MNGRNRCPKLPIPWYPVNDGFVTGTDCRDSHPHCGKQRLTAVGRILGVSSPARPERSFGIRRGYDRSELDTGQRTENWLNGSFLISWPVGLNTLQPVDSHWTTDRSATTAVIAKLRSSTVRMLPTVDASNWRFRIGAAIRFADQSSPDVEKFALPVPSAIAMFAEVQSVFDHLIGMLIDRFPRTK